MPRIDIKFKEEALKTIMTFYNIKTQVIQNGKTKPGDNQGSSITVKLNK